MRKYRGYSCRELMIEMLILSMEFTRPGHGDKGMLCAIWHACVPEIVRKMRAEGYLPGAEDGV